MLFPWSNELLLEINLSHAAPQTKFGQTCHRFKHLGIPPQTPVDSYFFKHICPNQNNKTKFTHVWNLSCQEILISCFMLNLWWVDWAYSVQNCFVFPKLFIVNFRLMTESQRNITVCSGEMTQCGWESSHLKFQKNIYRNSDGSGKEVQKWRRATTVKRTWSFMWWQMTYTLWMQCSMVALLHLEKKRWLTGVKYVFLQFPAPSWNSNRANLVSRLTLSRILYLVCLTENLHPSLLFLRFCPAFFRHTFR